MSGFLPADTVICLAVSSAEAGGQQWGLGVGPESHTGAHSIACSREGPARGGRLIRGNLNSPSCAIRLTTAIASLDGDQGPQMASAKSGTSCFSVFPIGALLD